MVKILETETRIVFTKNRKGKLVFSGRRVFVLRDKKLLEICCPTYTYNNILNTFEMCN